MSSVIKLVLNDDEMEEARNVGLARQALNRRLGVGETHGFGGCLLYTSPSPRD